MAYIDPNQTKEIDHPLTSAPTRQSANKFLYNSLIIFYIAFSGNAVAAIHQCANGEFRDTPCPNGKSEVVSINTENVASQPPADKIDFSGDDNQKLGKAIAELESMKVDAVDCKIGLKVKGYSESCPAFVRYFGENGHLSQSVDMLKSLANKGNFYSENKYEMDKGLGIAQEIINTKYFYDARNK